MEIQNLRNSPKVPFNLEGYILHSDKNIELIHLLIKPNEKFKKHSNPFDVIFFVIEGTGILTIECDKIILKATDVIKVSSEKNRSWENNSNTDLKLLVIKLL